jgi:hydrogenase/urease accessory protein HupE
VFYAVVQGIRGVEWAMRGYVDFTAGLSLVLFAIVIASTARISRPIGYIMGLSGLAYLAQGYTWGTGYTSLSANFVLNEKTYQFLIVVWAIWLLVSAWRMKESVQAAPA